MLEEKLKEIVARYPEAELTVDGVDMPDMADMNGELPGIIQAVATDLGLEKPILTPDIAISDCRYWRYQGTPAYWYGPGGEACSAANESVLIEDLISTVKVHTLSALRYLQRRTEPHATVAE